MTGEPQLVEAFIRGHHHLVRGFVHGFLLGRGLSQEAYFDGDLDFHSGGRLEWIKVRVGLKPEDTAVLITPCALAQLQDALPQQYPPLGIRILDSRPVRSASFKFSYAAFTPEDGRRLRQLFDHLPAGAAVSADYQPRETVVDEAKGVEIYAPEHDYELRAAGQVAGEPAGILRLAAAAVADNLIELSQIQLVF